jgi:anti-anti-sigma factor
MTESIDVWRAEPGVAIVVLPGEHDDFSSPRLARELATVLEEGLNVIIDLRQTTFLDSTSVSTLLFARKTAADRQIDLAVVIDELTAWPVRRLFELAHLSEVLPVVPGVEAALARTHAGWRGLERRSFRERRSGTERRRRLTRADMHERRSPEERRSGLDRRGG